MQKCKIEHNGNFIIIHPDKNHSLNKNINKYSETTTFIFMLSQDIFNKKKRDRNEMMRTDMKF
jgi:hypothetical protein